VPVENYDRRDEEEGGMTWQNKLQFHPT
jgi:hypothetical protein